MHQTTTRKDILYNICQSLTDMNLPYGKLVALTDGALMMCGRKKRTSRKDVVKDAGGLYWWVGSILLHHQRSLCGKVLNMVLVINYQLHRNQTAKFSGFLQEIVSESGNMPYHVEMLWLSRRKIFNRVFLLTEELCQFMDRKGKKPPQFCRMKSESVSWCLYLT